MVPNIGFIFLLLIIEAKSFDFKWTFANGTEISEPNYCDNHNCIAKCCPADNLMANINGTSTCVKPKKDSVKKAMNFSNVDLYDMNEIKKPNESLESKFIFVYNESFINNSNLWIQSRKILEDGSILMNDGLQETKLRFCVDFIVKPIKPPTAVFVFRTINSDDPEAWQKQIFVSSGMLISCFFLMLVLFVYCLLPSIRRGLWGVILMTYIVTVVISFILKAVQDILLLGGMDETQCFRLTSVMYYFILSNFFWSNVLSYHMWYKLANPTSRSTTKSRKSIGRLDLKEKRKYTWYSLYAFGIPALITGSAVIVDYYGWYTSSMFKPPFEDCLSSGGSAKYYLNIPVGILLCLNCILFALTAYYIWFVEHNMNNTKGTKTNTKSQKYSFFLYLKISALMGIGWLMELIPIERLSLPLFIFLAFYNVFTGVFIFFILVWKKKILIDLCKKFGIMDQYVFNNQNYSSSRRSSTKTTTTKRQTNNNEDKAAEQTLV